MNTKTSAWVIVVLVLYGLVDISSSLNIGSIKRKISDIENSYPYVTIADEKHEAKTKTEPKIEIDPVRVELTDLYNKLKSMKLDILKLNNKDLAMDYELNLTIIEYDLQSNEIEVSILLGSRKFIKEIEATLKKGKTIK